MPEPDEYTSISLHKGLRTELNRLKNDGETYNDVLHRAIIALDGREDRFSLLAESQVKQSAVLGKLARAAGLPDEEIPDNIAQRADMDDPTDFLSAELRYMFEDPEDDEDDDEADEPPTPATSDEQADVWGSNSPFAPDENTFEASSDGDSSGPTNVLAASESGDGPLMPVFNSEEEGAESDANRYLIDIDDDEEDT